MIQLRCECRISTILNYHISYCKTITSSSRGGFSGILFRYGTYSHLSGLENGSILVGLSLSVTFITSSFCRTKIYTSLMCNLCREAQGNLAFGSEQQHYSCKV